MQLPERRWLKHRWVVVTAGTNVQQYKAYAIVDPLPTTTLWEYSFCLHRKYGRSFVELHSYIEEENCKAKEKQTSEKESSKPAGNLPPLTSG